MEYAHMNLGMGGHAPFQQFGGTLPPGWLEYRTPTGQPYWYNTFTRQSSWQFPAVAVPQPQKKKQIKKKIPDTHWLFVLTPDGYEFYYDRETKTSVWEMPEELKEPMEKLRELEKQTQKEEEENKRKRALEEEEQAQEQAKKAKLEQEQQEEEIKKKQQEEAVAGQQETQEQGDATEMTEDDIMWQLQEMEELSGEQMEQVELTEEQMEDQTPNQEEQVPHQAVVEEKEKALTEQECIAQFNEMLKEKNISPFATYSTELPKLMTDSRFTMVKHNKQKALFNKYCKDLGEKMRQEKMNKKTPQEEFQALLDSKVTVKMYWDDFRRKYKNDDRFQALKSTKEKEALFKEHVKNNLNKKSGTDHYIALLRETKEIKQGIRWRDAKRILEKDDRYYAIESKEKREDMFRDYLDTL